MKTRLAVFTVIFALASGCASAGKTFGPDGRQAYTIDCSGALLSWSACFKKAGGLCKSAGYDTIAVNGQSGGTIVTSNPQSGIFATPVIDRVMVISCKTEDQAAKQ